VVICAICGYSCESAKLAPINTRLSLDVLSACLRSEIAETPCPAK